MHGPDGGLISKVPLYFSSLCLEFVYIRRQLEAIIRISEALAKMSLSPFATDLHVDEALRLFQVSTLEAAHSGRLAGRWGVEAGCWGGGCGMEAGWWVWCILCVPACSGADEFTSHTEQEEMRKIEKQLKNRFPVGSMVSEQRIIQDFLQQVTSHCN